MSDPISALLAEIEMRAPPAAAQDIARLAAALRLAMDGPEVDEDRQVPEGAWETFEAEIAAALRGVAASPDEADVLPTRSAVAVPATESAAVTAA